MTYTLIINSSAQGGKGQKQWPAIAKALDQTGIPYEHFFTEKRGHAISLTKELALEGKRNFVVVGGDGTLNEVINGICGQDQIPIQEFLLACIPLGSGSDWIKSHSIPSHLEKAIQLLKNPQIIEHDVGKVTYNQNEVRYFINVAGLAFDAFVVQRIDKHALKGFLGHLIYLYGLLVSLNKYSCPPFSFTVNNETIEGSYFCLNVGICKYSGGGMLLVPEANPKDALFDITVIKKMGLLEVLRNLPYLYNGKILKHKKTMHFRSSSITINTIKENIPVEVDGEFIGHTPVEFSLLKDKIKVITGTP